MRIRCKSILIVSSSVVGSERRGNYTVTTTQTTYDMNSVQSHEFDLPLFTHREHLTGVPVMSGCALILIAGLILPVGIVLTLLTKGAIGPAFMEWYNTNYP